MKKNLLANAETLPKTTVIIVCEIDTLGNAVSNYTTSIQNKNLNTLLDKLSKNIELKRCYVNGYTANAKAEFTYALEYNHTVVTAKKNADNISSSNKDFNLYRSSINSELSSAPYGKYTFDMNKTVINGQQYDNNKLIKTTTHGASNAFLSLLVPGLGDHRVSYGKKSGISVALSTYALIGGGIGLKFYSNSE